MIRAARLLPADLRLQPGARHALLRAVLAGAGRSDLPADWGRAPARTAPKPPAPACAPPPTSWPSCSAHPCWPKPD